MESYVNKISVYNGDVITNRPYLPVMPCNTAALISWYRVISSSCTIYY